MASNDNGSKRSFGDADSSFSNQPTKRARTENGSRVLFVRGLPADCLESELLALCCPFAVVEKSLLIPQKCQAFVQLPDVASATNLINFYQSRDAMIRGKKIFFEFSSRDEITIRSGGYHGGGGGGAGGSSDARHAHGNHHNGPPGVDQPSYGNARGGPGGDYGGRRPPGGAVNTILMVSVTNIEYDVTVDVLHQVFQKFGNVQKIVTFVKNDEFKALVQMETIDQAQAAQSALDGRDIYTGCNTLRIVFSRHPELRVRFNNDRARDFTNPDLPSGPPNDGPMDHQNYASAYGDDHHQQQRQPQQQSQAQDPGYNPQQNYGQDPRYGYNNNNNNGPPTRGSNREVYNPSMDGGADNRYGGGSQSISPPRGTQEYMDKRRSPVLICSNLDPQLAKPDRLFTFFGCYGDVIRVKIMFRKQDTALIQFVDDVHATTALQFLDGFFLFGKRLRVDYSKHFNVSMPRGEVDRFELENTRDYSHSPLHRYRRRDPSEAVAPCPLLHLSGIPPDIQRNQNVLLDLFANYGTIKNFHFIQKNPKMALIELGTVEEAVLAMFALDNYSFPGSHVRVSFSKTFFQPNALPVPAGNNGGGGGGGGGGGYPGNGADPGRRGGGGQYRDRERDRERDRGRDHGRDRDRGATGGMGRDRGDRGGGSYRDGDRSRDRNGGGGYY